MVQFESGSDWKSQEWACNLLVFTCDADGCAPKEIPSITVCGGYDHTTCLRLHNVCGPSLLHVHDHKVQRNWHSTWTSLAWICGSKEAKPRTQGANEIQQMFPYKGNGISFYVAETCSKSTVHSCQYQRVCTTTNFAVTMFDSHKDKSRF